MADGLQDRESQHGYPISYLFFFHILFFSGFFFVAGHQWMSEREWNRRKDQCCDAGCEGTCCTGQPGWTKCSIQMRLIFTFIPIVVSISVCFNTMTAVCDYSAATSFSFSCDQTNASFDCQELLVDDALRFFIVTFNSDCQPV